MVRRRAFFFFLPGFLLWRGKKEGEGEKKGERREEEEEREREKSLFRTLLLFLRWRYSPLPNQTKTSFFFKENKKKRSFFVSKRKGERGRETRRRTRREGERNEKKNKERGKARSEGRRGEKNQKNSLFPLPPPLSGKTQSPVRRHLGLLRQLHPDHRHPGRPRLEELDRQLRAQVGRGLPPPLRRRQHVPDGLGLQQQGQPLLQPVRGVDVPVLAPAVQPHGLGRADVRGARLVAVPVQVAEGRHQRGRHGAVHYGSRPWRRRVARGARGVRVWRERGRWAQPRVK